MQDAKLMSIRARALALVAIAGSALAGCGGGGSGAETQQNPPPPPSPGSTYNGPPPATSDVQAFKLNLWDNIQADNRCGTCHSVSGGQSPMFARNDDINLAYQEANLVVTLTSPEDGFRVPANAIRSSGQKPSKAANAMPVRIINRAAPINRVRPEARWA